MQQQNVQKAQLYMRHDAAVHLLAEALQQCFPRARVVHRHVNEEGFICEVALEHAFSPEDLAALEQYIALLAAEAAGTPSQGFASAELRRAKMIACNWPCQRVYQSQQRALNHVRRHGQYEQPAQLEQATYNDAPQAVYAASVPQLCGSWPGADWPDDIPVYQHGDFAEVCAGPHVDAAGEIGVCKLLRVESVPGPAELQRIIGRVES